jgi:hypothetical protein
MLAFNLKRYDGLIILGLLPAGYHLQIKQSNLNATVFSNQSVDYFSIVVNGYHQLFMALVELQTSIASG